jgi:hypothetical protein
LAEGFPQIVVQNLYTGLQQQVSAATGPALLLFLYKALTDQIVHGRFDEHVSLIVEKCVDYSSNRIVALSSNV